MAIKLTKVVSGGQTGVDRAGLDAAVEAGIAIGGWCPQGRLAEDGMIPAEYPLAETESSDYAERTLLNVRDSDGTLILSAGLPLYGGTLFTKECADKEGKPVFVVNLQSPASYQQVHSWMEEHAISVLNVAGPRASQALKVYEQARGYLNGLLHAASPQEEVTATEEAGS